MNAFYNDVLSLCDRIEHQWQKGQYASEDFYKIVWDLTDQFDLSPLGEVANQLKLLDNPYVRLNQHRSTFSDFHFQIFQNGHFLIEILNWSGSHVNVHDHDFSGVQFQLKGPSLNVVYDFTKSSQHGALRFGELNVRHAEYWQPGGRSMVRSGDIDPHSVFHLGAPTTSLLIRTLPTPRLGAQSNYFPTLAANYFVNTDLQRKKLTGLELLSRSNTNEFKSALQNFLDTQSYSENFFMLLKLGELLFEENHMAIVSDYADRGEHEASLVQSVIFNNGIDFVKTLATATPNISDQEKLALSAIAGTCSKRNLDIVLADLKKAGQNVNIQSELQQFRSKISLEKQDCLNRYLDIFQLGGFVSNEK